MTKVLVDTDILIDHLRTGGGPLTQLVTMQSNGKIEIYLSSITVMELYAGLSSLKLAKKIQLLLNSFLVIPFDVTVAQFAGELKRDQKFPTVPVVDYIIGSTAVWFKAQLATRNRRHFSSIPELKFFDYLVL